MILPSQFGSYDRGGVGFDEDRRSHYWGVGNDAHCLSINGVSAVVPAMVVGNVPKSGPLNHRVFR